MLSPRRTAFLVGPTLALLSVAGLGWWAWDGVPTAAHVIRIGLSGLLALPVGLAAASATWRGAVRWLALGVFGFAVLRFAACSVWVYRINADTPSGYAGDGFQFGRFLGKPILGAAQYWTVDWGALAVMVALWCAITAVAGLCAMVAVRVRPRPALVAGLLAVAPTAYLAAASARDGAEAAALLAALAFAWLVWTVRASRLAAPLRG